MAPLFPLRAVSGRIQWALWLSVDHVLEAVSSTVNIGIDCRRSRQDLNPGRLLASTSKAQERFPLSQSQTLKDCQMARMIMAKDNRFINRKNRIQWCLLRWRPQPTPPTPKTLSSRSLWSRPLFLSTRPGPSEWYSRAVPRLWWLWYVRRWS